MSLGAAASTVTVSGRSAWCSSPVKTLSNCITVLHTAQVEPLQAGQPAVTADGATVLSQQLQPKLTSAKLTQVAAQLYIFPHLMGHHVR